jgi:predicted Ser/Thr protein kinase
MVVERGTQLGPYLVDRLAGEGGMGQVYRARDTRLDRVVAIKVVREGVSDRFQREARAIAALNHPHICTLYDVGPDYLVMEYIEGEPLRCPMNLRNAMLYAGQILEALEAAHRHGIVHRDLKPSNIMVTSSGVKLLDFGLAKRRETGNEEATVTMGITAEHTVVGTPRYMAPEQIEGRSLDHRTDIFAFGCVLYEMIAGKPAFEGRSAQTVMAAVLDCDNRNFDELQAPAAVKEIVVACLRRDPDARWQAAHDLRVALTLAAHTESSDSRRPWQRAFPLIAAGVAAGALALVLALRSKPAQEELRTFTVVAPEDTKLIDEAIISPDGRFLAMVADRRLWIRPLASVAVRPVGESTEAHGLFWAPDSSAVGFFADGKLKRVAAAGGPPETLAATPGDGGAWSETGFIVYAPLNGGLYRVPAGGGPTTQLTALATGQLVHVMPNFLPDGRLMYSAGGTPDSSGVFVAEVPANGPVVNAQRLFKRGYDSLGCVPSGERDTCTLLFVHDHVHAQSFQFKSMRLRGSATEVHVPGESLPASSINVSKNGIAVIRTPHASLSNVVAFDRTGHTQTVITETAGTFNLSLSPDGTELVFARGRESMDLWLRNLERGDVRRLTSHPADDAMPVWSPDGTRVAFASWRDDRSNLYVINAHGSTPETRLLGSDANKYPTDWSRDGRFLLYEAGSPETGQDLWVLHTDAGANVTASEPYLRTQWNEGQGRFSPDGLWVAYTSNEGGRTEVYVQSFPAGRGKWQVSTGGGWQPVWRSDGRELYFVSSDRYMMAASVKPGPVFSAGEPKPLFPVTGGFDGAGMQYAIDAAGKTFYVITPESSKPDTITVVLNWRPVAN